MDIRNWPLDKIMQLPDWCFGRRWAIGEALSLDIGGNGYVISKDALPELFVVWEVWIRSCSIGWSPTEVEYRLGDELPAILPDFRKFQPLFGTIGSVEEFRSSLFTSTGGNFNLQGLRQNVAATGRRLVMHMTNMATVVAVVQAGIIISSVPREVPDWLSSGLGRNLL